MDKGCGRRVSEKRRTRAGVLASRKMGRIFVPLRFNFSINPISAGSEAAVRASTATATWRRS